MQSRNVGALNRACWQLFTSLMFFGSLLVAAILRHEETSESPLFFALSTVCTVLIAVSIRNIRRALIGADTRARWEVKIEDLWIGVFWRWSTPYGQDFEAALRRAAAEGPFAGDRLRELDVWICIVPCLPLHITIGPRDSAVPREPRWHCVCGCSNMPAWHVVCDRCRRPKATGEDMEIAAGLKPIPPPAGKPDCDCCERAGEYSGYGSGPTIFTCPKSCGCHD